MRAVVGPRCKVPSCRHEKEIRASLLRRQRCPLDGKKRGLKIRGERGPVLARAQLESDSQKSRGSDDKGPQMRSDAYSNENLDRLELIEPDDVVEDIMTPATALAKVRGDNSLQEVRKVLQDKRVEGVPVVDDGDKVVGVISRHDLRPLLARADYKTYLQTTVASKHMSTPPVCVRPHARIGEAAGVMLAYKVHRLPVVDEAGYLLGIVSRTDIFQPLLRKKESIMGSERRLWINGSFPDNTFVDLDGFDSLASVEDFGPFEGDPSTSLASQNWEVKYLYDGDCNLCMSLVNMLKRRDDKGKICFVNLRDPDYDPVLNEGITFEEGMDTIHVIKESSEILRGPEALELLYSAANLGWIQKIMEFPVLNFLVGIAYKIVSALRLPMQGESMDAILAARRLRSATNPEGDLDWQCTDDDDEGCEVPDDW
ncbi:hypothetical protein A3770_01p03820 [Chloropicon primus]|uniref:CBS domain-containing protein n=2 Tax=Chloropicon primus TaxID=1764295 RepID=A0A5B8MCR2_9CHLO|nr:hypothetical protein A3770_01p03820 [Chloropicon primus]|mmetsp:Transcript_12310/g.34237  ORF Transcript_12310/g.34237 Transcript_12310/m.34237 type:complete len:427 (+) Transcript_12310:78-1358(+)|eukprot:QDZ17864.1 hypothetical protein A3770_01p03820 [Chloropicon primus]